MEFSNDLSPAEKAKALYEAGRKAWDENNEPFAHAYLTQSLNLYKGLRDHTGTARALISLANLVFHYNPTSEDSWSRRARLAKEGLAAARKSKDTKVIIHALRAMAPISPGNKGTKLLEESLALAGQLGDEKEIAACLERLGAHFGLRDPERSSEFKRRSVDVYRSIDDKEGLAQALFSLSIGWDDRQERLAMAEESLALYRELGHKKQIAQGLMYIAGMIFDEGENDLRTGPMHEEVRDICHEIGVPIWEAAAIRSLADIAERGGEIDRATELRAEAEAIYPYEPPDPAFTAALEQMAKNRSNKAADALGKSFFGKKR